MKKAREKYEEPAKAAPAMMIETDTEIKPYEKIKFIRNQHIQRNRHTNHKNHGQNGAGRSNAKSTESDTDGYGIKERVTKQKSMTEYVDMIARVQEREHEEKRTMSAHPSAANKHWAMVHTPNAKKALDHEWDKLKNVKKAWDKYEVVEKTDIIEKSKMTGKRLYLGELMELCHLKHSEQSEEFRKDLKFTGYKGRVVFRGDKVRDESGFYAVFTEQSTSASHMSGGKFLDALARMPGMEGQISDAVSAYTQVPLPEDLETYITLPPRRRPESWEGMKEPVCRLRLNLYGHPLAGLLWGKSCEEKLMKLNFIKMKGWECMYIHKEPCLFLSVYVDDFKIAGKSPNVQNMWPKIKKYLDLDPTEELDESVYLGCGQNDVQPQPERYAAKKSFWQIYQKAKRPTIKPMRTKKPHQNNQWMKILRKLKMLGRNPKQKHHQKQNQKQNPKQNRELDQDPKAVKKREKMTSI